jgi:hypothetical protein
VQLAFAASVDPQVFDSTKSSASPPVTAIELKDKVEEPPLVRVTVFAAEFVPLASLPKANEVGLTVTVAALAVVPVPVTITVCGEPVALSAMLMLADLLPVDTGLKLTDRVQLAPAAKVDPQVFDKAKSSASAPDTAIELKDRLDEPLLVTVTVFAADVVPLA